MHLQIGNPAPELTAKNQNGDEVKLSDYKGKKVVLYFYPKDNTPTCTNQACNLRDNHEALLAKGYVVLGVSPDKQKTHQNFIKKFDLPFDLLTDTDSEIAKAFGIWGEKQLYGRKYMGVFRTTFIINEKGIIEEIISKVDSKNHAQQVLNPQ